MLKEGVLHRDDRCCERRSSDLIGSGTMRKRLLIAFGVAFALIGTAWAERLPIKAYTAADGLAHERVTCVVSDSRGFLWFCTAHGLSRFDGHSFSTHVVPRVLPDAGINDFLETSRGVYWVATNGGGVQRINPSVHPNLAHDAGRREEGRSRQPTVLGSRVSPSAMSHKPAASTCCMKTAADGCGPGPTEACFFSRTARTRRRFDPSSSMFPRVRIVQYRSGQSSRIAKAVSGLALRGDWCGA